MLPRKDHIQQYPFRMFIYKIYRSTRMNVFYASKTYIPQCYRIVELCRNFHFQQKKISLPLSFVCFLSEKEVYTFGLGQFGQLGHGTFIFETQLPKVVETLKKHKIQCVACGENHTSVITDSGLLYTFGDGRHGKLGLGEENFTNQFVPTLCSNFVKFTVQSVACGGCHMLVFATPRPKESEVIMRDDLKENYLTFNPHEVGEISSASLQRTQSARLRRREREMSPEQIQGLIRTLPPLGDNIFNSSLPVTSKTVPPRLLKVRQPNSQSFNANHLCDSPVDSMPDGENRGKDLVKCFSAEDDTDCESKHNGFGDTTDVLNMTHAMSMNSGNKSLRFSPVQKRKEPSKDEESEEEEEKDNSVSEKKEIKTPAIRTDTTVNTMEQEKKTPVFDSRMEHETDNPNVVNGIRSLENDTANDSKATVGLLEKKKRSSCGVL
ncbi:X-linked retinitis pigmentosa GTPase regulator-like isoform X4 [Ascaphus truei]|uniref:X-linked retinitis pigmentosa GTPase regulator-like isoform X4 n=1 Tax=Ascaphus truei TaxID=8439 RepID=UPI003F5953DB